MLRSPLLHRGPLTFPTGNMRVVGDGVTIVPIDAGGLVYCKPYMGLKMNLLLFP
jgi:hypothetical protein